MMERKLEKAISLFANAIFGDFLNHYIVVFLSLYVVDMLWKQKLEKLKLCF
jgi:hypothetical protein